MEKHYQQYINIPSQHSYNIAHSTKNTSSILLKKEYTSSIPFSKWTKGELPHERGNFTSSTFHCHHMTRVTRWKTKLHVQQLRSSLDSLIPTVLYDKEKRKIKAQGSQSKVEILEDGWGIAMLLLEWYRFKAKGKCTAREEEVSPALPYRVELLPTQLKLKAWNHGCSI